METLWEGRKDLGKKNTYEIDKIVLTATYEDLRRHSAERKPDLTENNPGIQEGLENSQRRSGGNKGGAAVVMLPQTPVTARASHGQDLLRDSEANQKDLDFQPVR